MTAGQQVARSGHRKMINCEFQIFAYQLVIVQRERNLLLDIIGDLSFFFYTFWPEKN